YSFDTEIKSLFYKHVMFCETAIKNRLLEIVCVNSGFDLDNVYKKMLNLTIRYEDDDVIERFVLFNHYRIHKREQYLEISTSSNLKHILNSITNNFTKFELKEMTRLNSTYSKNMFRLLKQYQHTGS
ncbi:RepB family plasmid replication initiator protein, partial [Staphylococcus aureus]|uniref:RepB family plasmid replication initiator protein n=1 Tax=Staphylococcus aureus TaxID=1280 RepID=UPI00210D3435